MNTNNDELEQMLGRQLHDQVDGMNDQPFGLGDVKGRAGRIQRNRRLAAGVGVAAVLAVIAPAAITAVGMLDADGKLDPAPSPAPTPVQVARTTLSLDGLERGDAPAVEYFTPDGVVLPGEGLRPTEQSYQAMIPSEADGGWVAVEPAGDSLAYLDEDFQRQGGPSTTGSLAVTPDRGWYAFVTPESGAQSLVTRSTTDPEAGQVWDLPEFPVAEVVDFVAEDSPVFQTVDQQDGSTRIFVAEPDGSTIELPGYVTAMGASPANGLVSVMTEARKDGSGCFGVVDPDRSPASPVWETCDYKLGTFSPDGRYVMASDPDTDGFGLVTLSVLDAETGDLVATFTQNSRTQIALVAPVWESPDTIVALAAEGEDQVLVRLGVDGTQEETVEPVTGEFGDLYYYLARDRARL